MDAYLWFSIFLLLFRKSKKPETYEIQKISRFLLHEISNFQYQNYPWKALSTPHFFFTFLIPKSKRKQVWLARNLDHLPSQ